jgi:hypothetical protein
MSAVRIDVGSQAHASVAASREAVRAVVRDGSRLLLLRAASDGEIAVVTLERRAGLLQSAEVFAMDSRYYLCSVAEQSREPRLESYEEALGLRADWVEIERAITVNEAIVARGGQAPWVSRELEVLRLLADATNVR